MENTRISWSGMSDSLFHLRKSANQLLLLFQHFKTIIQTVYLNFKQMQFKSLV